jgi:protein O-mannosyl-transferase
MKRSHGHDRIDASASCPQDSGRRLSRAYPAGEVRCSPPPNRLLPTAGVLLTLGVVAFLYRASLRFQFVYDDLYQIALNPHLRSWHFLPIYFTQNVWSQLTGNTSNFYRPFFLLWLRVNFVAFGDEPAGWHLTTLLIHLLAVALVYLLARALLDGRIPALFAAMVFGVHPIHLEAVAWVSGVNESLAGALFLASLLTYLQWEKPGTRRPWWLAGSLALYGAAMLVKETAAVLPAVLAAYHYCLQPPGDRKPQARIRYLYRENGREIAAYGAVLFLELMARTWVLRGFPHQAPGPLRLSLLSWPWLFWRYVAMLFWPTNLSPLYDFLYVSRINDLRFILPLALIACSVAIAWRRKWLEGRLATFVILWFVITLSPAFVQFLLARPSESYHDRYLYLPSVALALWLAAAFERLCARSKRWPQAMAWTAAVFAVILSSTATHRQISYWESNYSLFARAYQVAPRNELAASNLAAEFVKRKQYPEALHLSEQMIELHPGSVPPLVSAAYASFLLHDYVAAEQYYERAVELDPEHGNALYMLALARIRLGKYSLALDALRRAASLSPREPLMHYALGVAFGELEQWTEARDQFLLELQANAGVSQALVRQALENAEDHLAGRTIPARFRLPARDAGGNR